MLASEVPKVTKAVSKGATYSTFLALIICQNNAEACLVNVSKLAASSYNS